MPEAAADNPFPDPIPENLAPIFAFRRPRKELLRIIAADQVPERPHRYDSSTAVQQRRVASSADRPNRRFGGPKIQQRQSRRRPPRHLPADHLIRWADQGMITRHKINARVVLFDEAEVVAFIESARVG